MEIWKLIPNTNNRYEVSNWGRARSYCNNNEGLREVPIVLNQGKCKSTGYFKIAIWDNENKKHKTIAIHRIVAELFINNPKNKRCVNHIDANKENNHYSNLEWCTHSENSKHAVDLGITDISGLMKFGESHGMSKITEEDVLYIREQANKMGRFYGQKELSKRFGISKSNIKQIVSRNTWTHI